MKHFLAILTALMLGLTAANAQDLEWSVGAPGNSCYAKLEDDVLIINGGTMKDFTSPAETPWYPYRNSITSVHNMGGGSIGNHAFQGYTNLTSLSGGGSVGSYAFYGCTSLTSISVSSIGSHAFYGCTNLTSASCSAGATTIGSYAFYGCSNLTNFTIDLLTFDVGYGIQVYEYHLTTIGDYAFGGCTKLGGNIFPKSPDIYSFRNTVTYHLTTIGEGAFYGTNISSVEIPSTITSIGNEAFGSCPSLTSVVFFHSVTNPLGDGPYFHEQICRITWIGDWAFANCPSLTSLTMPYGYDGTTPPDLGDSPFYGAHPSFCVTIGGGSQGDVNAYWAAGWGRFMCQQQCQSGTTGGLSWNLCSSGTLTISGTGAMPNYSEGSAPWYGYRDIITSVVVESGVTSIGDHALLYSPNLTSVTLPEGITRIGWSSFNGCTSLASITLPNSITSFDQHAFQNTGLTEVTIPDRVNSIGDYAFYACGNLTNVILTSHEPPAIGGGNTFVGTHPDFCVTVPQGALNAYRANNSWKYCTYCHDGCRSGTAGANVFWQLCNNVLTISGTGAMNDNQWDAVNDRSPAPWWDYRNSITSVVVENGITNIGDHTFCFGSLTSATLPNSVTRIGWSAFNSASITEITLPGNLTNFDQHALRNTGLTSVTIPNKVTFIGDNVFYECHNLTSVILTSHEPPTLGGGNVFGDVHPGFCVTVPSEAYTAYQSSSWSSYLCSVNMYAVTFNAMGGSPAPPPQAVVENVFAAAPSPAPTRAGYTLAGWYADTTNSWYNARWSFAASRVTRDTTLYARWVRDVDNGRCAQGMEFIIKIPFRSLPSGVTAQYRWYRNGVHIEGSDGVTTSASTHIICTIPPGEAFGVNHVFHFEYWLNDGICHEWTSSPKYTFSFLPQ